MGYGPIPGLVYATRSTEALIGVVHRSSSPVGAANQEHYQICGKRGGISPLGPSAWPPRSSSYQRRGALPLGFGSVSRC